MTLPQTPGIPIEDLMGENQPVMFPTVPPDEVDDAFNILEGAGLGDYGGAPLADAFDDGEDQGFFASMRDLLLGSDDSDNSGFITNLYDFLVGQAGGTAQYFTSDAGLADLIAANLFNGRITQQQAISELMAKLHLDYDEAEGMVLDWVGTGTNQGTAGDIASELDDLLNNLFGDGLSGGSGGRRSGGGGVARTYAGPDSGLVSDWVKSQLTNLVGRADDDRVAMLTEKYFDADRAAFGGESIDPKQTVREAIREFDDYKRIHANRTDMEDEDTWITGQMSALLQAGVSGQEAEQLAINFAQAGVSKVRAGELSEARRVGSQPIQALPGFFSKVKQSLSTVARSVR